MTRRQAIGEIRKDAGLCCGSRRRSGEVFAYVGSIQKLKDLKAVGRVSEATGYWPRFLDLSLDLAIFSVPTSLDGDLVKRTMTLSPFSVQAHIF